MKIGLMLGGGGAKGSYQVGLLEVLEKTKIIEDISIFSGASIGAINGYFYLGSNFDSLKEAWIYGAKHNPITGFPSLRERGFYSMNVLKEIEEKFIDKEKFVNSNKDLYLITTEVKSPSLISIIKKNSWQERVFHLNNIDSPIDYVISSASIPVVFGANELQDKYFIDGGLINNNPVDILIEKGANLIFVSPLEKPINYELLKDKDVTIVELTPKIIFPQRGLDQLKSIVGFELSIIEEKISYGNYVANEMLKECVNKGILKYIDGQYSIGKIKKGFRVIKVPAYVEATVSNMMTINHLKRKDKKNGDN